MARERVVRGASAHRAVDGMGGDFEVAVRFGATIVQWAPHYSGAPGLNASVLRVLRNHGVRRALGAARTEWRSPCAELAFLSRDLVRICSSPALGFRDLASRPVHPIWPGAGAPFARLPPRCTPRMAGVQLLQVVCRDPSTRVLTLSAVDLAIESVTGLEGGASSGGPMATTCDCVGRRRCARRGTYVEIR